MVKMFKVAEDEKCGGCNWEVANLCMMAENQESANIIYKENERGLCGDCIAELLMDIGYIIPPQVKSFLNNIYAFLNLSLIIRNCT